MTFSCRTGCGACCIAPSIANPFHGMPAGKAAGQRCAHLTVDNACALFGRPERPQFCSDLRPSPEMCGDTREQALATLARWESETLPGGGGD